MSILKKHGPSKPTQQGNGIWGWREGTTQSAVQAVDGYVYLSDLSEFGYQDLVRGNTNCDP